MVIWIESSRVWRGWGDVIGDEMIISMRMELAVNRKVS